MKEARCERLVENVLNETIPMHSRMIHGRRQNGKKYQESQKYDAHGRVGTAVGDMRAKADLSQHIQAVDRAGLNKRLLDALEKLQNVTLHFNHKLTGANFDKKVAWFEKRDHAKKTDHAQNPQQNDEIKEQKDQSIELAVAFDLLIGADGAHSAARYHMMKFARVTYQQEYIDTLWCEFHITPKDSTSRIDQNHLHIWPAGSFMFIAIPSLDNSFTCTLFAPAAHFNSISEDPDTRLSQFFDQYFPGVCPDLIPEPALLEQFRSNPHLPLISIKCRPYHYKSSVVILGDSAHAMVPFYGQGMNAGLEDVRVLFEILDKNGVYDTSTKTQTARDEAREQALVQYSHQRAPDAAAINDLALRNYEEMRSGVQSPLYKMRKWMEETVNVHVPILGWRTQYTRISFENQRYSEVERDIHAQSRILMGSLGVTIAGISGLGAFALIRSNFVNRLFGRLAT